MMVLQPLEQQQKESEHDSVGIVQGKSLVVHMGIAGITNSWPELIPLVQSGRIKGEGKFTHYFVLSQGAEAYRLYNAREDGVIKVMLTP